MCIRDSHKLDAGEQQAALALGVNPNIVEAKAVKVDLNEIVAAARKLNISMSAPSAQTIRREAFFKALGETQLMFAANQQTIDSLLHYEYSFPDFSEWSTWRHGFLMFFSRLFYFFARFSGILLLWLPWLFVFFVLTLSAKDLLGVTSERVGALIALISAFILLGASFDPSVSLTSYLLYGIALAGVSCITGCWAIRFGKRARLNYRIGLPLAFFIAILLVALLGLPRTDLEMAWVPFGPIWVFGFCGWMAMAFIYSAFLCMFAGFGLVVIYYLSRIRLSGGDRHIPPKT